MTDVVDEVELAESVAALELALEDQGWRRLAVQADHSFSREGLRQITALARLMVIANPLIRRAVNLRHYYVWGQGVHIGVADDTVNDVVQAFLDDQGNEAAVFGPQAQRTLEADLTTDGQVFLALFTHPRTGRVQVRTIPFDEIDERITDPDDRATPWFYRRVWSQEVRDETSGNVRYETRSALHPDWRHQPKQRPARLYGQPVRWDAPIMWVEAGIVGRQEWAVPDVYAALSWARAYKEFLEDWSGYVKALSRFAWQHVTKSRRVRSVKQAHEADYDRLQDGSRRAGATAVTDQASELKPIQHSGAHVDSESGKQLAMMVGAAMDLPITLLLGDADMGNHATAQTLDRPTELAMRNRQTMWGQVLRDLCRYAIRQAVKAPDGPLTGRVGRDEYGREVIEPAGEDDVDVRVTWPPILEHDVKPMVESIGLAAGLDMIPPEEICRLLLVALGVDDIDGILDTLTDDDGRWLGPTPQVQRDVGQAAIDAFRRGDDPASLLR